LLAARPRHPERGWAVFLLQPLRIKGQEKPFTKKVVCENAKQEEEMLTDDLLE